MESRALSDEDRQLFETLKQQQAQADEDRKRKDGEWSKLKDELMSAHQTKLQELQASLQSVQDELTESDLLHAFYGATVGEHNLFGEQGLTVLTPEIAMPYFRQYVEVVRENGKRQLVVKNQNGSIIRGDDGDPAPFAIALRKLIQTLPHKDRILRGSGRSGSGNAGGAGSVEPEDMKTTIQKARQGDKDALNALKDHQRASGGLTSGRYWERRRGA